MSINPQQDNPIVDVFSRPHNICLCKSVSKQTIIEAFKNGATTLKKIQMTTLACTGCGTCMDDIKNLLVELSATTPQNKDNQTILPF